MSQASDEVHRVEPYWQAQLAVLVALGLLFTQPGDVTVGPPWLTPSAFALLLIGLAVSTPYRSAHESVGRRRVAIAMIALVTLANTYGVMRLVHFLLHHGTTTIHGNDLIRTAAVIWLVNVIIFALWFWEIDRGGPGARLRLAEDRNFPDFFFQQMDERPDVTGVKDWMPVFVDYLYTSLTNSTAFSPTDVLPLTHRAKALMGIQSVTALTIVGLVAARAVNILA